MYADECGSDLLNLTRRGPVYLSSKQYPYNYQPYEDCTWIFQSEEEGTYVITILDLNTEWWDTLSVGLDVMMPDNVVVKLSLWYYPKTILINTTEMFIRFFSNELVQFRGFLIEVERIPYKGNCFRFLRYEILQKHFELIAYSTNSYQMFVYHL